MNRPHFLSRPGRGTEEDESRACRLTGTHRMQNDDTIHFVDSGQQNSVQLTPDELSQALQDAETRPQILDDMRKRVASGHYLTRAAAELSAGRMIDNGAIQFSNAELPGG